MEIILSVAGTVITLMLGIIGYFIVRNDKRQELKEKQQERKNDRLSESIDKLSVSVTSLNGVLLVLDEKQKNLKEDYDRHKEKYHE